MTQDLERKETLYAIKANGAAMQGESLVNQMAVPSDDLDALAVEIDKICGATSFVLIPTQARRFAKRLRQMSEQMDKNLKKGIMAIG